VGRSRLPDIITRRLVAEVPDADLLDRYLRRRDDDAFARLVARYHRLVWGLCRNMLADDADADDAFRRRSSPWLGRRSPSERVPRSGRGCTAWPTASA
jgi:hypothetical protein